MKKLFTLLLLSISFYIHSQEYNKWSIEPEIGITKIRDVTQVVPLNFNIGARYMTNTLFGIKLDAGYTRLHEDYEFNINDCPIQYYTGSLHGVINIGRLLNFESFTKNYTILSGVGGTYSYSEENTQLLHRLSNFHLSGFIDNEIKLSNKVFLRGGLDVITGVNSRPFATTVSTETTTILNFNVGLTITLGKNKEHADWYITQPSIDTLFLQPKIIDKTITKREIYNVTSPKQHEYVFFHHDSYIVDKDGLNAIVKSSDKLTSNGIITVIGYASPPGTSDYNITLSKNRALAVVDKLISLGIEKNQINLIYKGEVDTINSKNVDVSRRVTLIVK